MLLHSVKLLVLSCYHMPFPRTPQTIHQLSLACVEQQSAFEINHQRSRQSYLNQARDLVDLFQTD